MRSCLRFSVFVLTSGCFCLSAQGQESLSDLAWLAGAWQGTMGKAQIEEHWIRPAGGTKLGLSRTVAGGQTVSFEFLRIESRADGTLYVAQPQGRSPVEFRLTLRSENRAFSKICNTIIQKLSATQKKAMVLCTPRLRGTRKGRHTKMEFNFQRVSQR